MSRSAREGLTCDPCLTGEHARCGATLYRGTGMTYVPAGKCPCNVCRRRTKSTVKPALGVSGRPTSTGNVRARAPKVTTRAPGGSGAAPATRVRPSTGRRAGRPGRDTTPEKLATAARLRREGLTWRAVGAAVGLDHGLLYRTLNKSEKSVDNSAKA